MENEEQREPKQLELFDSGLTQALERAEKLEGELRRVIDLLNDLSNRLGEMQHECLDRAAESLRQNAETAGRVTRCETTLRAYHPSFDKQNCPKCGSLVTPPHPCPRCGREG